MPDANTSHITILLACYKGEAFLREQLASIAGQSHRNWSLIVSDDGSKDRSRDIVRGFAATHGTDRVRLIDGPRQKTAGNFLHLIGFAPAGMIAFCDQDDVWLPDKLERATAILQPAEGPAHYAARTIICDAELRSLTGSRFFTRPLGFRNALVQACMAGNCSVFNAAAAALLKAAAPSAQKAGILSHDWWAYQVISGADGALFHDRKPALYYRQHGRSEVGRNDTGKALFHRFGQLFAGEYGRWLHDNFTALTGARDLLSAENRELLDRFGEILELPGPQAVKAMLNLGLYRQTIPGSTALYTAAALGKFQRP